MALMARILGIPARVGIGFLPGQAGKDGEYIVRMHDMHAWPELYFQGVGWVRFEPTPSARVATTPTWTDADRRAPTSPTTGADARRRPSPGPDRGPGHRQAEQRRGTCRTTAASPSVDTGNWWTNGGGKVGRPGPPG